MRPGALPPFGGAPGPLPAPPSPAGARLGPSPPRPTRGLGRAPQPGGRGPRRYPRRIPPGCGMRARVRGRSFLAAPLRGAPRPLFAHSGPWRGLRRGPPAPAGERQPPNACVMARPTLGCGLPVRSPLLAPSGPCRCVAGRGPPPLTGGHPARLGPPSRSFPRSAPARGARPPSAGLCGRFAPPGRCRYRAGFLSLFRSGIAAISPAPPRPAAPAGGSGERKAGLGFSLFPGLFAVS